uniref:BLM10_mid domain-containing protein n=1 Tax=Angiostrongylus cantonensis TaxID=6313 RepID=A0A158P7I9_ANGCA
MIDLLVTCKSRVAYASGSVGLWNSMYMLSRVYPENSRYMSEKLDRSLKEWVPIREWGRLYEIKDMKMAWHIPNNRGNAVVEEMLKKFLFPVMDLVNSVEVDRPNRLSRKVNEKFLLQLVERSFITGDQTSELSMATEIKDEIFTYLTDPVKKGYPSYVYESLVYVCHMKNATATSSPFTEFHLRVVRLLTRLSLNVYAEVRLAAQAELALVFAEYTLSSEAMIDSVIPVLTDQEASKEKIRGALNVILKSKWATDTRKSAKMKVWQALLDMNTIEMPAILKVFEEICNDIGNMQKPSLKHYKCEKLLSFCEKMFEKLPKTSEWQKFNCKNSLDLTRQIQEKKRNKSKALANNFPFSHSEIILSKFTDEDQYHRERSADELSFWLKKNKALTIRMDWICPKKPQESIPLKCGIRADNMALIYDSENLPNTEEKWNNTRAEQRLAAEFFAGVAMGTKYYGFSVLNKLWSWLAPAVDLLYDYLNEDAYFSWHFCMTNVLHRDDTRRYWWLIEELLKGMARTAPTAWHHAVALKNVCVVLDANMNNDFRGLPNRFHLESVDFWLQRFEGNLGETPNIKSRLASETVIQFGGGVKANELAPKFMAVHSSSSMVDLSQIYLRTLLEFLLQYYTDCITCLTPRIVSLFPVLLEYANEGDNDIYGSFKDMDISHSASLLIHEEMSTLQLTPKFADSFLNVVVQSFYTSYLWRVKVSVLKFIQVLVFSNIYELEKATRREKILKLLYDAIVDPQTEVRREASRAMLTLILCGYIEVNDDLSKYFNNLMKNKNLSTIHGAILGMGAVVRAHPFSTPLAIKPMLAALCEVTSHNAELQKAATTALREFRRTHRDNWQKVAKILGPDLVYKIENAIAPVYYA